MFIMLTGQRHLLTSFNFYIKENGVVESKNAVESKPYTSWQMCNCQLILNADTFDIIALTPDSLTLEGNNGVYSYKRVSR